MGSMKMSEHGRELLTQWEGSENDPYKDVAGLWTIGVGHLLIQDELSSGKIIIDGTLIKYRDGLTDGAVQMLLAQDLAVFENAVNNAVSVSLNQNQFDALVSFSFNAGAGAFRSSTLLKKLNKGNYSEVPTQFRRWVFSGGQKVQGLINRRENEVKLWNGQI